MSNQELDKWIYRNLFEGGKFVGIKKRGLWYRPNAKGYTDNESEAGRYTCEEAKKHEYLHDEPVTIHEFSVPHYTTSPADAFEVLKKCKAKCGCIKISTALTGMESVFTDERNPTYGLGETLELAICLFAQKLFTTPINREGN